MFKALDYAVTFPSTGRTLSGQFSFQTGFGAIVGPNEAGKSVILEMMRFCLFGTAALRGPTTDYKSLKVTLGFQIRDETYTVRRTISTAKLFRGDTEIVNGVKPVNSKIVDLLGFGMTVFDVACAANQGDIEKLGAMRPAERKRMVDSVIGLSVIDELADWCGKEALGISRLIEGLDRNLVRPVAPVQPEGYTDSASLRGEIDALRIQNNELSQLRGWLAHIRSEPVAPAEGVTQSTEELQDALDKARRYNDAAEQLAALPAPPEHDAEVVAAELDAYDLWREREEFLRTHPRTMTADEIAAGRADDELRALFAEAEVLEQKLAEQIEEADMLCCPKCSHQWPLEQAAIDRMRARAEEARALVAGKTKPAVVDMVAIIKAERQLQAWDRDAAEWERLKDVPEATKPAFTRQQLAKLRAAAAEQARRPALEALVAELEPHKGSCVLIGRDLRDRIQYETLMESYTQLAAGYENWERERFAKQEKANELAEVVAGLPELEQRHQQAVIYEAARDRFSADTLAFIERQVEIEKHRAEEEGYQKGKASLVLLRKLVKQHLVPSLNRVASHLIKQMTGGERQTIEVTDEFEIMVDGQGLDTLSGSGKAVANLALRIGLGQVLTNGQFSVFLGDEIDASMDKDRAQNTALTLECLAERVSQILLVTHKYPPADYYIELGKHEAPTS